MLYDVLGVSPQATPEELKEAYRRAAQRTHPDRKGGSEEAFKKVGEAFETLSDPERRARYDATGSSAPPRARDLQAEAFEQLVNLSLEGAAGDGRDLCRHMLNEIDKARRLAAPELEKLKRTRLRLEENAARFKPGPARAALEAAKARVVEQEGKVLDGIDLLNRMTKILEEGGFEPPEAKEEQVGAHDSFLYALRGFQR